MTMRAVSVWPTRQIASLPVSGCSEVGSQFRHAKLPRLGACLERDNVFRCARPKVGRLFGTCTTICISHSTKEPAIMEPTRSMRSSSPSFSNFNRRPRPGSRSHFNIDSPKMSTLPATPLIRHLPIDFCSKRVLSLTAVCLQSTVLAIV